MESLELRPGRYKHFKGGEYQVFCVARLIDSDEEFVVYQPLYGDQRPVIRPKSAFMQTVSFDGRLVPRFAYLDSGNEDMAIAADDRSVLARFPTGDVQSLQVLVCQDTRLVGP